jgi:N-acetylmuramoyl-L-alanine amidase
VTRRAALAIALVAVFGVASAVWATWPAEASHPVAGHQVLPSSGIARQQEAAARSHNRHVGRPLAGMTVGIDPGHNGRNYTDPAFIDHKIWNGREYENCNTTGTATDAGYPEARFTWRVASYLRRDLRAEGARVVMTRHNNHGVGPCVNRRARIINRSHAAVGIDIHGDGGPPGGRGFAVLEPVRDKENRHIIGKSAQLGGMVRHALLAGTSMPESTYDGVHGITHRRDLAGLNLTRVPLVLVECGNMRNATDARLMTSAQFQQRIARAFTQAMKRFALRHRSH